MFTPAIQDTLKRHLQVVPDIIAGKNFRHDWDELIAPYAQGLSLAVIDDVDTASASGDAIARALQSRFNTTHITLARGTKADDEALAEINQRTSRADMLVAVGSGSINDLVKYTAAQSARPYLLCPTAASMNGYVSASAPISIEGHKQSLPACLPLAVFIDLSVICAAPTRLTQAGIGDSLARSTAQADCLLSHHLLGTAYEPVVFDIMKDIEPIVFEHARAVVMRDAEATEALIRLILLSGFGMTIAKSSAPASGGEHMIAHAISMTRGYENPKKPLHGEEMAVTTLLAVTEQDRLLSRRPRFAPTHWPSDLERFFDAKLVSGFSEAYQKKAALITAAFPSGEINANMWERAQAAIASIHLSPARILRTIEQSGLPLCAEAIGWNDNQLNQVTSISRFTRDRMSWLDLE